MLSKYKAKLVELRATAPPTVNKNVILERFKSQDSKVFKFETFDKPTVVGTLE